MNKYQTTANNDPSVTGLNRFDKNVLGGTGYRPYLQGGSKFRATGAGPYCAYESINGADKASECKTVEVILSPKIINYSKLRIIEINHNRTKNLNMNAENFRTIVQPFKRVVKLIVRDNTVG